MSQESRTLLLVIVVLLLTAMGAYVALAAVLPGPIDAEVRDALPMLSIVFAVLAVVSLALWWIPHTIFADDWARDVWRTWSQQVCSAVVHPGSGAPLVAVSLFVVTTALRGNPIVGPEPGTLFARIGLAVSYAVPILLIAFSLVGHAIRDRSASFAFTAGLLFNTAAHGRVPLVGTHGAHSSMLCSGSACAAQRSGRRRVCPLLARRDPLAGSRSSPNTSPAHHAGDAPCLAAHPRAGPDERLPLVERQPNLLANLAAGHWLGWVSLAATFAAAIWLQRLGPASTWAVLVAVASLISMTLALWDSLNWLAFHALLIGHTAVGGVLLAVSSVNTTSLSRSAEERRLVGFELSSRRADRAARSVSRSARAVVVDGAVAVTAAILAYAGGWALRQRYLYLACAAVQPGGEHLLDRPALADRAQPLRYWHGRADRDQCVDPRSAGDSLGRD